jgi:hypothetical protein
MSLSYRVTMLERQISDARFILRSRVPSDARYAAAKARVASLTATWLVLIDQLSQEAA